MPKQQATHARASKLAQLLGEIIVHHTPWTSKMQAEAKRAIVDKWLDELELHTAAQVGPFLQKVLDSTNVPEEFRHLIDEALDPHAAFSSLIEQIFLWGIVSNIISAATQPFVQSISNEMWSTAVDAGGGTPLPPSSIATAVGRGLNLGDPPTVNVPQWAVDQAKQTGVSQDQINLLSSLVGLPPALQELFALHRRGIINLDEVKKGLQEGDFRDDWIDNVVQLAHDYLTPADFIRAAVQGQMDYTTARQWASTTGLDVKTELPIDAAQIGFSDDMFGLGVSLAGRPPGPAELGRMANRGIIHWQGTGAAAVTFQQGIAESDVKTKWTPYLAKLTEYVPPPRSIGTLLTHGAITHDQAVAYWQESGVPTQLAQSYAFEAEQQHIEQQKLLARGEILTAYYDSVLNKDDAAAMLGDLGYEGHVAKVMLEVVDFRREISAINRVVSKIETLYGSYKLSAAHAKTALEDVGISGDQADRLLHTWEAVRTAPVRLPTVSEIGAAVHYGTIDQAEALDELAKLGYQPRDAAIVLSAHAHIQVAPLPAAGSSETG